MRTVWRSVDDQRNRLRTTARTLASARRHREHSDAMISNAASSSRALHSSSSSAQVSGPSLGLHSSSSAEVSNRSQNFRTYLSDVLKKSDLMPSKGKHAQSIRHKLELMTLTPGSEADMACKHRVDTCAICIGVCARGRVGSVRIDWALGDWSCNLDAGYSLSWLV